MEVQFPEDIRPIVNGERFVIEIDAVLGEQEFDAIEKAWLKFWSDREQIPNLLVLDAGAKLVGVTQS